MQANNESQTVIQLAGMADEKCREVTQKLSKVARGKLTDGRDT